MKKECEIVAEIPFGDKGGYTVDLWSDGRVDFPVTHVRVGEELAMMIMCLQKAAEAWRNPAVRAEYLDEQFEFARRHTE